MSTLKPTGGNSARPHGAAGTICAWCIRLERMYICQVKSRCSLIIIIIFHKDHAVGRVVVPSTRFSYFTIIRVAHICTTRCV